MELMKRPSEKVRWAFPCHSGIILREPDNCVLERAEVIEGQGLVSNIMDVERVLDLCATP